MVAEILGRTLLAVGIIGVGIDVCQIANKITIYKASENYFGLENLLPGIPAIIYFTTPTFVPCKIGQRPAIQRVKEIIKEGIQKIEFNASLHPEIADDWGGMRVPKTFILDNDDQPR